MESPQKRRLEFRARIVADGGPGHVRQAHVIAHVEFVAVAADKEHFHFGMLRFHPLIKLDELWGEFATRSAPVGGIVNEEKPGVLEFAVIERDNLISAQFDEFSGEQSAHLIGDENARTQDRPAVADVPRRPWRRELADAQPPCVWSAIRRCTAAASGPLRT